MKSVWISGAGAALAVAAASAGPAQAAGMSHLLEGNGWIAIAVVAGLVLLVWLLISGVLSVAKRDSGDDDSAGFGVIEDIDEDDDDRPKKKK